MAVSLLIVAIQSRKIFEMRADIDVYSYLFVLSHVDKRNICGKNLKQLHHFIDIAFFR